MRRFVPVATTLAALLAGCGGSADRPPAVASEPPDTAAASPPRAVSSVAAAAPRVPRGFRLRRLPEAGLQLAVPRGWIALGRREAVFPGTAQTLVRIDRGVAGALAALAVPESPLHLLALVPAGRDGGAFRGMLSLVVTSAEGTPRSFDVWARQATRALLAGAGPDGRVESRRVRLPVGAGVRLAFERVRAGKRVRTLQVAALAGDRVVLLVLTTTPEAIGSLERRFDALARTLSRLGDAPTRYEPRSGLSDIG